MARFLAPIKTVTRERLKTARSRFVRPALGTGGYQMGCPLCGSLAVRKDYPPVRGYALVLAGMGLLFFTAFVDPAFFSLKMQVEGARLYLLGLLLCGYGGYCLFRHGRRYCAACGCTFRQVSGNLGRAQAGGSRLEAYEQAAEAKLASQQNAAGMGLFLKNREAEKERTGKPGPSRTGPLIACLSFKDPIQRASAAKTLCELTGQDFGEDPQAWKNWFAQAKNKPDNAEENNAAGRE